MATTLFIRYSHELSSYDREKIISLIEKVVFFLKKQIPHDLSIFTERRYQWINAWEKSQKSKHKDALFIVFMTPDLVSSPSFREELDNFFTNQKKHIIWIEYQYHALFDREKLEFLKKNLFLDWTKKRFLPVDDPYFEEETKKIALFIQNYMKKTGHKKTLGLPHIYFQVGDQNEHFGKKSDEKKLKEHIGRLSPDQVVGKKVPSILKRVKDTIVMDPHGNGDFPTLAAAVSNCPDHGTIFLKSGVYLENLIITRPIQIRGEKTDSSDAEIRALGTCTLLIESDCSLKNLTIRQFGGIDWYAIDIRCDQCVVEIDCCAIRSDCNSCIAIHDGADPYIHHCTIHDSSDGSGIFIYDQGRGRIEHNIIRWNKNSGIEVKSRSQPQIRHNTIRDNAGGGISFYDYAGGVIEENEISDSAYAGIQIEEFSNPLIRKNHIVSGAQSGIYVKNHGEGLIVDNDIVNNQYAGIAVEDGGAPTVQLNRIHFNNYGIWVYDGGCGVYENNDLQGNRTASWLLREHGRIEKTNNIEDK